MDTIDGKDTFPTSAATKGNEDLSESVVLLRLKKESIKPEVSTESEEAAKEAAIKKMEAISLRTQKTLDGTQTQPCTVLKFPSTISTE